MKEIIIKFKTKELYDEFYSGLINEFKDSIKRDASLGSVIESSSKIILNVDKLI